MSDFLEILKYILPALVVFATIYFLFSRFMNQQYRMKLLEFRQAEGNNLLPLKFQAYERLVMMLERMEPSSMFLRLNTGNLTAAQMRDMMLIALNQEYEYNMTQQLYVSDKLWAIIKLAKEQTANLLLKCSEGVIDSDSATVLIARYDAIKSQLSNIPLDTAKSALKQEMQSLL
jgi:hypothetical protein